MNILIQFVTKNLAELAREEAEEGREEQSSRLASLQRSVKNNLLSVIKRKPAVVSWTDELSDTLGKLGLSP